MKNSLYLIVTAVVFSSFGCSSSNHVSDSTSDSSLKVADSLQLKLSGTNSITKDSVPVTFTVVNHSDSTKRFCKWDTPFEPLLGKYLSVKDKDGQEAGYKGAMAKRIMPPPADSYIAVKPQDSISVTFNLTKGYDVKPGDYKIDYIASGISGLKAGNQLKVTLPEN